MRRLVPALLASLNNMVFAVESGFLSEAEYLADRARIVRALARCLSPKQAPRAFYLLLQDAPSFSSYAHFDALEELVCSRDDSDAIAALPVGKTVGTRLHLPELFGPKAQKGLVLRLS